MGNALENIDKLSELIRLAVSDARRVMKRPGYVLDMSFWHTPIRTNCIACLGGCVIAGTLKGRKGQEILPSQFPEKIRTMLLALNAVRSGKIDSAASVMGQKHPDLHDGFTWFGGMIENRRHFYKYLLDLADWLEARGL